MVTAEAQLERQAVSNSCPDDTTRVDRVLDVARLGPNRRTAESAAQDRAGIANGAEEHVGVGHDLFACQEDSPSTL